MDETWRAFGTDMAGQVSEALDGGRSPSERAYGVGVIVHNYFRTRGITLTSYELRALANELVEPRHSSLQPPLGDNEEAEARAETTTDLVSFADREEMAERVWAGDELTPPPPVVADTAFAAPPSKLVNV